MDSHAFVWMVESKHLLSAKVQRLLADENNTSVLSFVSIWELQIKIQLGKLTLHAALNEIIDEQQTANNLRLLSIQPAHIYALKSLPMHHRDPFDRLLIAQAKVEGMSLLSQDRFISQYDISVIWKDEPDTL